MQLGSSTIYGDLKVTGQISGVLIGNSATAEALTTARTITFSGDVTGSVSFDGSKDVTMTTTVLDNSHNHTSLTDVTSISGQYGTMITSTDEWLKINSDASHSSGTYYGNTTVRTDGILQVGNSGSAFNAPNDGKITASTSFSAPVLISTVAVGTAPLTVTSSTLVTNFNADLLDGMHATSNNTISTVVSRDTNGSFSAGNITLTGATIDNIKIGITGTNEIDTSSGNLIIDSAGGTVTIDDNLIVSGNLTINGTTTTVNSTITTLDDPVITLGGDTAPSSNDSKDRGVEYRWHNGTSSKIGFFGLDSSSGNFTFIPDATNSSEVFSGTKGTVDAYVDVSNIVGLQDKLDGKQSNIIDVECTTLSATAAKIITIPDYTLTSGDMFAVKFTLGSSVSTPTLNVNGVGAKNIRLGSTNATTTTMSVGTNGIVLIYYDGSYFQLLGSHRTSDGTVDANMYHSVAKTMGATLYSRKLIAEGVDRKYYPLTLETGTGTTKTVSTAQLKLGGTILYYDTTTTVNAGSNVTSTYSEISMTYLNYTFNQSGGYSLYEPIYLVGQMIDNITFTLDNTSSTSFYTQDLPTTEDGKIYIYLGHIYGNNSLRLTLMHPIYEFKDGDLRRYIPSHAHNVSEIDMGEIIAGNGLTGGGTLVSDVTITLGTPSDISATTTSVVTATSHTHSILSNVAASSLSNSTTNTIGTSASLARADHTHTITGFALVSHGTHVTYGSPVALSPDSGNIDGVSSAVSRTDHKHDVPTAVAVGLSASSTNTEGTSTNFARADHTHAITGFAATSHGTHVSYGTLTTTIVPDTVKNDGSSTSVSRTDHTHAISTDTAVGLSNSSTSTEGSSTNFARADHTHTISGFALVSHSHGSSELPATMPPSAHTLDSHSDVSISSIASGEILKWDGTNWINNTLSEAGISPTHTHPYRPDTWVPPNDHTRSHTMTSTSDHTASNWKIFYSNGSAQVVELALGSSGQVLKSNGASAAPSWQNDNNSGGTITSISAGNGMNFTTITASGSVTLGTPSDLSAETTNNVTTTSHTHNIVANVSASSLSNSTTNTIGTSAALSRANHTHAITGFALVSHGTHVTYGSPVALSPDSGNIDGVSSAVSRSDHKHNIPAATAVELNTTSTSTEGTSGNFARADHTHAITGFAPADSPSFTGSVGINSWSIQQDAISGSLKFIYG